MKWIILKLSQVYDTLFFSIKSFMKICLVNDIFKRNFFKFFFDKVLKVDVDEMSKS